MGAKVITLKHVAKAAGCSLAAASTVLNKSLGTTVVSAQTGERIAKVARELGYRPNFAASSLVRRSTRTIGVYFGPTPWADLGNPYYEALMMRGIEIAAKAHDFDLLLVNVAGGSPASLCVRKIEERRVDGLILIHVEPGAEMLVRDLLSTTTNLIAVDCLEHVGGIESILFDNQAAIELAVDHLLQLGHRSIGFLGPCMSKNSVHSIARKDAFLQLLTSRGLPFNAGTVHGIEHLHRPIREDEEFCQLEGVAGMRHFLSMGANRPTALVAYNDLVAAGAYDVLSSEGLVAGRDVSIVGVDDSSLCRHLRPTLTSIRHPLEEMASIATRRLIERIIDGGSGDKAEPLPIGSPQLVIRKSTGVFV